MPCGFAAYLPALIIGQRQTEKRGKDFSRTLPRCISPEEDAVDAMRLYHPMNPFVRHPKEGVRQIEKHIFADKRSLDSIPHPETAPMRGGKLAFRETAVQFKDLGRC